MHWYRLPVTFRSRNEGPILHSTLQAIMKHSWCEAFPDTVWQNTTVPLIFYHVTERKAVRKLKEDETFPVEYIFIGMDDDIVNTFSRALEARMKRKENTRYYTLEDIQNPERRTPDVVRKEYPEIPDRGTVMLEFLSPLPFDPDSERGNTELTMTQFKKVFFNRFRRFFGDKAGSMPGSPAISIDSSELQETTLNTHQKNGVYGQRIHGCTGTLALSGELSSVRQFLHLGAELHAGTKLSSSMGYFVIREGAAATDSEIAVSDDTGYRKPLFITTKDVRVSVSKGTVIINGDGITRRVLPLNRIDALIVLVHTDLSTRVIDRLTEAGIPVVTAPGKTDHASVFFPAEKAYFQMAGRHISRFNALDEVDITRQATEIAVAKLAGFVKLLRMRHIKGTAECINLLKKVMDDIKSSENPGQVRGFEGYGTKLVYDMLGKLITAPGVSFEKREHAEPDYINVLLNFCFSLLYKRILTLLIGRGLNPYLGFLHSTKNRYHSLVCDVQEPFRAALFGGVLTMINRRVVTPDDFVISPDKLILKHDGRNRTVEQCERVFRSRDSVTGRTVLEEIIRQVDRIARWAKDNEALHWYRWR